MKYNDSKAIDLKRFLPYRLSALEQQVSLAISRKYSNDFDLSRMQWRVLSTLAMFEGITAKEICCFTHMEKMQASRAISGLESRGLLRQRKSTTDNRANVLSLTGVGQKLYQQIVPEVLAEQRRIFACFTSDERVTFERLVDKMYQSLVR